MPASSTPLKGRALRSSCWKRSQVCQICCNAGLEPNTKRFKRTLIYYDTDTQYAVFREIPVTLGSSIKLLKGGEVVLKVVTGTNNKLFYNCKSPRNLTLVVCLKGMYGISGCSMPTHSFLSIHLLYCFHRCATHGDDAGSRDAARVPAGCHGN